MILKHMCSKCQHSGDFHTGRDCSYSWCPCRETEFDPEPTVVPTWDERHQPVLTVTPPGSRWPERGNGYTTCACDACQEKYAALVGATRVGT
jgi:hypothetical protein